MMKKKNGQENALDLEDDLYENKSDESESDDSDDDDFVRLERSKDSPKVTFHEQNPKEVKSFRFYKLLIKVFFTHVDKLTLVVIYFVSVTAVNVTHVVLVLIFVVEIIIPKQIRYVYKILVILFQVVFLIEFIIDVLKIHYFDEFNDNKKLLELFLVYRGDKSKCDIEILLYGVIYCFYFQNTVCKLKYVKRILNDETITYENYFNNKFDKLPTLKSFINIIYMAALHAIFWSLIFFFIFFFLL